MLTLIAAPSDNERSPRYAERAFAAIHEARLPGPPVTLIFGAVDGQIGLMLRCTQAQYSLAIDPLIANYPNCSFAQVDEPPLPSAWRTWSCDVQLKPDLFPILRHSQFEDLLNHNFADPVSGLLRSIRPDEEVNCRVEISVAPASHRRCHEAAKAVRRLDRAFFRRHHRLAHFYARHILRGRWRLVAWLLGRIAKRSEAPGHTLLGAGRLHDREEDLHGAAEKITGGHLFEVSLRLVVHAPKGRDSQATERLQGIAAALGAFTKSRLARFEAGEIHNGNRQRSLRTMLMSHEELATLFHPPTSTAAAERMPGSEFTELEGPVRFHSEGEEGIVPLGRMRFRDDSRIVTLGQEDRRRHQYIVGKTGMGKTTLLQNMIVNDLQHNRGVCLIDPHGDLAESILAHVPRHRSNDVIYLDAADRSLAISFNPLACSDPQRIDQVTSGVVSAIKQLNESWGPRLEDLLRNSVFAIIEQGGNLLSVMRLLGESAFRERTVIRIQDEVVRSFFLHDFAEWSDAYRTEAVAAIQNKLRPFLISRNIRAIVTHDAPSLNLRQIIDDGQILLINLSKGRLGEDNSTLLGAFLVTSIQQAAMTRADIREAERTDFYLYVDEFQNFTRGNFASIMSEARKYRLNLIVAHQHLSQLDEETANAVWGNAGSVISFAVGSDDAQVLARQLSKFEGQVKSANLTGLPKYTAYARLVIAGLPSRPFSLQTLPPPVKCDPDRSEIIRRMMRRRFGVSAPPVLTASKQPIPNAAHSEEPLLEFGGVALK